MNVLAFDCCFGAVSAAVRWRDAQGGWQVRELHEVHGSGNAERLFPMIAQVLKDADRELAGIDRVAVTLGPGTFTGVRVGVAAARALALATGKPVAALSSLAVMALGARELDAAYRSVPLTVAMDARRGMIYVQHFHADDAEAGEPMLCTPLDAARAVAPGEGTRCVVGSGAEVLVEALHAAGRAASAHLQDLQPHAGALARIAPDLRPQARITPIYLRQPDTKEQIAPSLLGGARR